jgi:hypothetical protein
MTRPSKFSRALASVVVLGGSLATAAATTLPAQPARIAPPCSPDGSCTPNYQTWGWYATRWRPFPGDCICAKPGPCKCLCVPPTPAGGPESESAPQTPGGPQPPKSAEESAIGPPKPGGGGRPGGGTTPGASEAPTPTLPESDSPAPGILPPIEEGPQPGSDTLGPPAGTPDALPDPLDPFGAAPPAPPAWMVENAGFTPLPTLGTGAATAAPAAPVTDGPNLHGDDAPPELPPSLQSILGVRRAAPLAAIPAAAPQAPMTTSTVSPTPARDGIILVQPPSIRVAASPLAAPAVVPASAALPLSIPLVNPASTISTDASQGELEQAIYIEDEGASAVFIQQ